MKHEFLWQTALILVSIKLAGHLSRRLGQPSVLGKLLVGIILGPALLGILHPNDWIKEASEVGVVLLMFLAGLETDLGEFKKSFVGALAVAVLGVAVPFAGGWGVAAAFGYSGISAVFIGVLLVATSVSISVQTLRELGRLASKEGTTILAAAVIDDVLGLIVLSITLGMAGGAEAGGSSVVLLIGKIAGFLVAAGLVGWFVLPPLVRAAKGFQVGAPRTAIAIAAALAFGFAAEQFGVAAIVGAYLAGLALGAAGLGHDLMHEVETVTFSFFAPFFFVNVGLAANFAGVSGSFWVFALVLAAVAIITKVIGCGLGAKLAGFGNRSSLGIGAGMIARGEVGLIVAAIGLDRGIISRPLFTAMVAVALLTTLVTPPMLKAVFSSRHAKGSAPS